MRRRRRIAWPSVLLWVFSGLILLFLILPLVAILPLSLSSSTILAYPVPGFSFRWYEDFFTNAIWMEALRTSLLLAVVVTIIATAIGTMAALGLRGSQSGLARVARALLLLPLVMPVVILAVAIFYLYAVLGLVGSFWGLVLAHTVLALPFVVVTVSASLARFDVRLLHAAASLGAAPLRSFFSIQLPLIRPGMLAGAVFAFVTSFDELVVTLFVGGPAYRTLPRQIWSGVRDSVTPTITAAAVVLALATIVAVMAVEVANVSARRRAAVPGSGTQGE